MGTLDPRTLIIVTAITLIITSSAVLLGGYVNRRSRGVYRMVMGYLLMALGVGLGATQDIVTRLVSAYLANLLILGGLYLAWMGVRQLQHMPLLAKRYSVAGFVLIAVLFALMGVDSEYVALRIVVFSIIAGAISLLMARELLTVHHRNISDVYTGILFVLLGIAFWFRAVSATVLPVGGNLLVVNTHTVMTYLAVIVLNLLLAFGYIMMMTERLEKRLRNLADTDYLTGMNCRRAFVEQVERILARAQIDRHSVAMILLDIDDFKKINDTYGHAAGDEVLRDFASNMSDFFRIGDVLGRIGGEEFGVVLANVTIMQAADIAERLRKVFEASLIDIGKHHIQAKVSIGVASSPQGHTTFEELYHRADEALYEAKKCGKNCVRIAADEQAALEKRRVVSLQS
jgi:diguanylate cyclase (GGDEF)-like protein